MDIVQLLDEYKVNSPASMHLANGGIPSPTAMYNMQPNNGKTKGKQRKSAKNNHIYKDHDINSPLARLNGLPPTQKSKARKKKGVNAHPQSNNESSSVGTVSPGNSLESQSPQGYDLTPSHYENAAMAVLSQPGYPPIEDVPLMQQQQQSQRTLSDLSVMHAQYNPNQRLNHEPLGLQEWIDSAQNHHHQQQQQQQQQLPMQNSPPNPQTGGGGGSPMGHGIPSPIKAKTMATSPRHIQAMCHAQQSRVQSSPMTRHEYSQHPNDAHMESIPVSTIQSMYPKFVGSTTQMPPHYTAVVNLVDQYPTPPSQHSHMSSDSPPQHTRNFLPDHFPTPSPDSPGQWSSSSPHSAQSDWSEGISSPVQPIGQNRNKRTAEPVYI